MAVRSVNDTYIYKFIHFHKNRIALRPRASVYPSVTGALTVNGLADIQYLRFLVVLQHSVGVEGGGIVHLLHVRARLLTLRETKSFITNHLCHCHCELLCRPLGRAYDHQWKAVKAHSDRVRTWGGKAPSWQERTLTRAPGGGVLHKWKGFDLDLNDIHPQT